MKKNKQKVAIITGASRGIGKAIALKLDKEGFITVLVSRSKENLKSALKDFSKRAIAIPADVSKEDEVVLMVEKVTKKFGRIDVLVNNAAVQVFKKFSDTDIGNFDDIFGTNVRGAFLCAKESLRYMKKQGSGQIVNIASARFQRPQVGTSIYAASKEAFSVMFSQLNLELRQASIKIATIYPSKVATEWRIKKSNFDLGESMLFPENIADIVCLILNQGKNSNISEMVVNNVEVLCGRVSQKTEKRTAVIIGASRGIGRALAFKVDKEGFNTVLAARNKEKLSTALNDFSSRAVALPTDVSNKKEVDKLINETIKRFGRIDILVYCVGGGGSDSRSIIQIPPSEFEEVFRLNLFGAYYAISAAAPYFKKQKSGQIFLISSPRARTFSSYALPYLAAKTALNKLAHGFYRDLMKNGVKITVFSPSFVANERIIDKIKNKKLPPYFLDKILSLEEVTDIFWAVVNQKENTNVSEIVIDNMLLVDQLPQLLD